MKKIITIIALFPIIACGLSYGNDSTILTAETNIPRDGDNLEKQEIQPIPFKKSGDSILWDLSEHKTGKKQIIRYRNGKEEGTIIENEPRNNKYYRLNGDTLMLTRHTQAGMSITYLIPECIIKYPIQYGGSISGYFYGEGDLGNITYIRNAGYSANTIDAQGTLVTPDGDTIKNVIRSHYLRTGTTRIAENFNRSFMTTRDSSLFSCDSIRHWMATDSVTHSIERWQWHAPGYRYPIAEAEKYKIYYYGTPVDSISRYYYYRAVDQQYNLGFDYDNEAIRYSNSNAKRYENNSGNSRSNGTYQKSGNSPYPYTGTEKPDPDKSGSYGGGNGTAGYDTPLNGGSLSAAPYCNVYPTIVNNNTTISYGTIVPTAITVSLRNSAGGVMWHYNDNSQPGDYSVSCPMESLPAGDYVIITFIGETAFTTKIIKK